MGIRHFITYCNFRHAPIFFGVQVKVVLRVSPTLSECQRQPPVLRTDPSKKRVTVMEPISQSKSYSTMTLDRAGKNFLKTFSFDAAYPQESSQVWFFILITAQRNSKFKCFCFCFPNTDLSWWICFTNT